MARKSSRGFSPIQVNFNSLYGINEALKQAPYQNSKQVGKQGFDKNETYTEQSVPSSESTNKKIKRVPVHQADEIARKERERQEASRREEAKRIERLTASEKKENSLQGIHADNLPLREAIILSEIIGQPRCRSRFKRRGY